MSSRKQTRSQARKQLSGRSPSSIIINNNLNLLEAEKLMNDRLYESPGLNYDHSDEESKDSFNEPMGASMSQRAAKKIYQEAR